MTAPSSVYIIDPTGTPIASLPITPLDAESASDAATDLYESLIRLRDNDDELIAKLWSVVHEHQIAVGMIMLLAMRDLVVRGIGPLVDRLTDEGVTAEEIDSILRVHISTRER
ncbi:hypothetical protein [Rhodococcus sp. IEGM 1330]|uniref:hypothetical protein n=1 Tax=Rhodococcus sp. IEGM 1330 TaxID=3082225 RepID=UPI002952FA20|nr:hypothetical protein [Rhodococcus sp. IEGM 1330]MDV8022008.1 hypothetical protein [Rhodococcus sp. IEGM 1330]